MTYKFLFTLDFGRIVELIISGAAILWFYLFQKKKERIAKEKEVRFNLYETKKIEAVISFITKAKEYEYLLFKTTLSVNNNRKEGLLASLEKSQEVVSELEIEYGKILYFLEDKETYLFVDLKSNLITFLKNLTSIIEKYKEAGNFTLEEQNIKDLNDLLNKNTFLYRDLGKLTREKLL